MLSQTILNFLGIMIDSGMAVSLPRHWEVRAVSKEKTARWDTEFPKPFEILASAYDPVTCLTAKPYGKIFGVCFLPFELIWARERTFRY